MTKKTKTKLPKFLMSRTYITIFLDETGDHLEMLMRNSATGVVPLQNSTPKRLTEICVTDGIVRSISYTYYL